MASVAADGHADAALTRLEQPQSQQSARGDEEMKDASAETTVESAAIVDEQQQQASSDVARMSPEPAALAALRLGCTPPGSGSDNGIALQHTANTDAAAMQDVGEHKSGVDNGMEEVAAAADPTDSSIGAADALVLSPAPSPQPSPKSSDGGGSGGGHPFGDPRERPYDYDQATTTQVKWVYRAVNFLTDLFFGVDKDLDHLPSKRKSVQPTMKTGSESLSSPTPSLLPPSISAGYGELSWQGFDKLLNYMENTCPPQYRLGTASRFLDIGSGFGKCIFHAKLRCKVARSIGIECIKTRHEKALESLHLLRAGFVPGLSDQKDAPDFAAVRNMDLSGCELFEGDISQPMFHPLVQTATHIYAFDVVFSKDTHAKLLPLIARCNFTLFGCYLGPSRLATFGVTNMVLLNTIKVHTTGKQSFTCFFYRKAEQTPEPGQQAQDQPQAQAQDQTAASAGAITVDQDGATVPAGEVHAATAALAAASPAAATADAAASGSDCANGAPRIDPTADPTSDAFYEHIRNQAPKLPEHLRRLQEAEAAAASPAAVAAASSVAQPASRSHKKKPAGSSAQQQQQQQQSQTPPSPPASSGRRGAASGSGHKGGRSQSRGRGRGRERSESPGAAAPSPSPPRSPSKQRSSKKTKAPASASAAPHSHSNSNGHSARAGSDSASKPKSKRSHKKKKSEQEEGDSGAESAPTSGNKKRKHRASSAGAAAADSTSANAAPKPKPLTKGQLFDLASAAMFARKPSAPRRSNNSTAVKLDPLVVAALPKQLSHYLTDAPKQAVSGAQIQLDPDAEPVVLQEALEAAAPPMSAAVAAAAAAALAAVMASPTEPALSSATNATPLALPLNHKAKQQKLGHASSATVPAATPAPAAASAVTPS